MRVFHTTRGQVCMQVGRVQSGQLGVLGLDSAFDSDGRFHALPTDALPPGYGGSSANVECVEAGQTLIFEDANADRSAERLLPEEFRPPLHGRRGELPPARDLRTLAYGVLGPHAVSVTYRTSTGLRTVPVTGADGAFLIVEPAGLIDSSSPIGGSVGGEASAASVDVTLAGGRVCLRSSPQPRSGSGRGSARRETAHRCAAAAQRVRPSCRRDGSSRNAACTCRYV